MGLGLSALVALLLLLPGIAFVFALHRLTAHSRPPSAFDQHFSVGLLLAVGASLALHLFGIALVQLTAWLGWTGAPAPALALVLLAGDLKAPLAAEALAGVDRHVMSIGGYLLLLCVTGGLAGQLANRFLIDRPQADWGKLLAGDADARGGDVGFVVLTAEVDHADATWLYSGYLDDYFIDREGRLQRVVFRGFAARRLLRDQDDEPEPLDDPTFVPRARWTEIPGEVFVLQMADARTVNIDFFFDEVDEVPADPTLLTA